MFRNCWLWFLAFFHLSDDAVCVMSLECKGLQDYHDYTDSEEGLPMHFAVLTCKRCGKAFTM